MPNHRAAQEAIQTIHELVLREDFAAAEAACRQLVKREPNLAPAWAWLGCVTLALDKLADAEAALKRAVRINPQDAGCWDNLSIALSGQSRFAEAESCSQRAIAIDPSVAGYWLNLGGTLADQERYEEATGAYRQALKLDPNCPPAWLNLGAAENHLGRWDAAQQAFERGLALAPDNITARWEYANLLIQRSAPARAVALLEPLAAQFPQQVLTWHALGNAYEKLRDFPRAEAAYRRALALDPRHCAARHNLALVLGNRLAFAEAESCVRQNLADYPDYAESWTLLGAILQARGQMNDAIAALRRSVQLQQSAFNHSRLLSELQYLPDITPAQLLAEHRDWTTRYALSLLPAAPPLRQASAAKDRLRIGFVSADFGQHPTGFLVLPALEALSKLNCTLACYSDRLPEDEYKARFRAAAHLWRDSAGLSDEELARQIRADEIDILFDLMGHAGNRLLVFARRPATLQITWFGYVGTTGLSAMDFLLADRFHIPPGDEPWYTESILRMPSGYACYQAPDSAPPVGPLPAAQANGVTFGCFNNQAKYSPQMFSAWAAILHRVPNSRLLLKYNGLDQPEAQSWIHGQFSDRGIDLTRILLEGGSPHRELLATYNRIDLALDTQPYSGGLTTCEALWMGVPVITFPGRTFAGRHSVSHLTSAGYPQFIAAELDSYIDLAALWANRLDELATIRSQMRDQVCRSPLCDASRFAGDLLALLHQAWEQPPLSR